MFCFFLLKNMYPNLQGKSWWYVCLSACIKEWVYISSKKAEDAKNVLWGRLLFKILEVGDIMFCLFLSVLGIYIFKRTIQRCMLCLSLRLLKTTSYGVLSSSEISTFQNCLRKAHVLSVSLSLSLPETWPSKFRKVLYNVWSVSLLLINIMGYSYAPKSSTLSLESTYFCPKIYRTECMFCFSLFGSNAHTQDGCLAVSPLAQK